MLLGTYLVVLNRLMMS